MPLICRPRLASPARAPTTLAILKASAIGARASVHHVPRAVPYKNERMRLVLLLFITRVVPSCVHKELQTVRL